MSKLTQQCQKLKKLWTLKSKLNQEKDVSSCFPHLILFAILKKLKRYSLIKNETQQLYEYGSRKFIISNSNPEPSEDSSSRLKSYFLRSSSHISAALYIVICLLCFSLFINIILLYISKMKHIKSKKSLLSHEICDLTSAQSNRSGSNKSASEASTTDCNLNLINNSSGGSATSGLDSEI